ncbi:MAG: LuxR family transcriptional regulator [Acidimicrobiia bacterium]|nr:MAG: LuxR family transcriptional regulator [Acidimicrobiia bacterium]
MRGRASEHERPPTRAARARARPGAAGPTAARVPGPAVAPAVWRERPVAALERAAARPVTVIVAPPGAGKTTLCRQWASSHRRARVAWLAVSARHDDPARFAADLRAAVAPGGTRRRTAPGRAPRDVPAVIGSGRDGSPTTLVVDDLHLLPDASVDALVGLVARGRGGLHVVAATRRDPPARLQRLRWSDELAELRAPDLAFTGAEAAALVAACGRHPDDTLVEVLVGRTEGWAAGVHHAALALRDAPDPRALVESYPAGAPELVRDVTDTVLAALDVPTRRFLVDVSVLERLDGPLCDHVTNTTGGRARLDALARACSFVERLPGGHAYRVHGVLRAGLQERLRAGGARRARALAHRAARWHLDRGEPATAVGYLAAAHAWDELLRTAAGHADALLLADRPDELARWLDHLPPRVRANRPRAGELRLLASMVAGEQVGAPEGAGGAGGDPVPAPPGGDLVAAVAATLGGDADAALRSADRALHELAGPGGRVAGDRRHPDPVAGASRRADARVGARSCRGVALALLARPREAAGELERADHEAACSGNVLARPVVQGWLALVHAWEGRLGDARGLAARALQVAAELGLGDHPLASPAGFALAHVAREQGDLGLAAASWERAAPGGMRYPVLSAIAATERALLAVVEGRPGDGLAALADGRARLAAARAPVLDARLRAAEGRLLVAAGELDGARQVLQQAPESPEVASVRVRIALERHDLAAAADALDGWPDDGSPRARLTRRLWQAVLDDLRGDPRGVTGLAAALADAETEHWCGCLRDQGRHALGPLRTLERSDPTPFLREVLARGVREAGPPHAARSAGLTERERDVLELLASGLPNAQLAVRLGMSLNTLKTHLKHIYWKLGVSSRAEAVVATERRSGRDG